MEKEITKINGQNVGDLSEKMLENKQKTLNILEDGGSEGKMKIIIGIIKTVFFKFEKSTNQRFLQRLDRDLRCSALSSLLYGCEM